MLILITVRCVIHAMIAMVRMKIHACAGHPSMTRLQWLRERNLGTMTMSLTSESNTVRLAEQKKIDITPVVYGQEVSGWITSTQTQSDGPIYYGPFDTCEEALKWAQNLINAVVEPIYHPTFNRG